MTAGSLLRFHWYCRFYLGRRTDDDGRQISRWKGVAGEKGRWKRSLVNKVQFATRPPDISLIAICPGFQGKQAKGQTLSTMSIHLMSHHDLVVSVISADMLFGGCGKAMIVEVRVERLFSLRICLHACLFQACELWAQCIRANKAWNDGSVSPVVRQSLLHWAYELTEPQFDKMAKTFKG